MSILSVIAGSRRLQPAFFSLRSSMARRLKPAATMCLCAFVPLCLTNSFGIEIQLGGDRNNGGAGGARVGYVDMEKIFHEYPETQKAMLDYQKEVLKKREDIARLESQLLELKQKKAVMEQTFPETSSDTINVLTDSTATVNAVSLSTAPIADLNNQIEQQERLLMETKSTAEKELIQMEERRSLSILGKIYKTLGKLAEAEGVSVVVDKSSVLYGVPGVDLTEKLQKRLRGE